MKKTVSILLLFVFLFNVGGYYLVFWGLQKQANEELRARLDANLYTAEETVELKIPMTLPYPLQQQGFERVDGKFQHNGQYYKLVKHKLENDTLFVVCIRDHAEKNLASSLRHFVKLTSQLPSGSKKTITFLGKFLTDFESATKNTVIHQDGWSVDLSLTVFDSNILSRPADITSPPPRV